MLINEIKNFGPSEYINCPMDLKVSHMDLKVSHMDHQTGPWTTPLRRSAPVLFIWKLGTFMYQLQ